MRFIVDECVGPAVALWLAQLDHDVFSVFDDSRGIDDDEILELAVKEDWIIVTSDKDFGEKIFRDRREHRGVVLLRLTDERSASKIATLQKLLESHADKLAGQFVVVSERQVRFARKVKKQGGTSSEG
jgi:predicted nuclease of predicted toxin-antitoxin system